jgi:predicted ABC-type ATPase
MFRSDIETLADILDEHIEKGLAKEESKSKIERIEKALSHDPFHPVEMGMDSPYYSPYKIAPEGGFLPYSSQHWEDQGKDRSNYITTDQFYERYGEVQQAMTRFRGFARSLENDLMKAGAVPIGTVHQYTDGLSYKKIGPGDWRPVTQGKYGFRLGQKSKTPTPEIERHARNKSQMEKITAAMKDKKAHEATRQAAVQEAMKNVREVVGKLFDGPLSKEISDIFDRQKPSSTDLIFKQNGKYIPSRRRIHEPILSKIVDSVKPIPPPVGHKPVAVFTAGGPGSGKSSMVRKSAEVFGTEMAMIAADEIKKEIPEYSSELARGNEDAAIVVHEESTDLAAEAIERCIEGNKPFLLDSTFKNVPKFQKMIARLKEKGYEVHVLYAHCDEDEAARRAKKRQEQTGRKVDEDVVRSGNRAAKEALKQLGSLADSTSVFDTQAGGAPPPKLVYHGKKSDKDESAGRLGAFRDLNNFEKEIGQFVKSETEERLYDRFLKQIGTNKYTIDRDDEESEIPFGDRIEYQKDESSKKEESKP